MHNGCFELGRRENIIIDDLGARERDTTCKDATAQKHLANLAYRQ